MDKARHKPSGGEGRKIAGDWRVARVWRWGSYDLEGRGGEALVISLELLPRTGQVKRGDASDGARPRTCIAGGWNRRRKALENELDHQTWRS